MDTAHSTFSVASSQHDDSPEGKVLMGESSIGSDSKSASVMTSPLSFDIQSEEQEPPLDPSTLRGTTTGTTDSPNNRSSWLTGDATDELQSPHHGASPVSETSTSYGARPDEYLGRGGASTMPKLTLYETSTKYFLVGSDIMDQRFRMLKIDRTLEPGQLGLAEDDIVYSRKEMLQLLNTIDDGNKSTGGLKLRCTAWGLLGFIRFTGAYYMLIITKRSQVAMIGGHYIYQIDGTELISLTAGSGSRFKSDNRNVEESRFLGIMSNLDLTKSFYYSYSYNITRTLQHNIMRAREALANNVNSFQEPDYNSMFVWNHHLLQPAASCLKRTYDWCQPVIHGYMDQAALSVYGRTIHIIVIARRSRYFAGARFLKRGANDLGYVANDVETEQIVTDGLTTSFHGPGQKLFTNPGFTSYVQHRGSIPLYWTQDNTGVTPKPPIELNLVDPFYSAAAAHFDNLFERYGAPVYVLNLVKAKERTPRESKLLIEFTRAIDYLNQFLPPGKRIYHKPWDMSKASKSRDQDVIGTLEDIAEDVMLKTGFFHNSDGIESPVKVQNGVARTNCIDCLDRTNAAQFVIGKRALGHQLHALGVLADTSIEYDTDAINLFTQIFHQHGSTIAVQYAGSSLVNTMETYRKINQWTSHSRDMVESFKRYYNNSFLDGQRQEAYNLFLGNYIFAQGQPMLWDLSTDYYLHHTDPRRWMSRHRRSYIQWYDPKHISKRKMVPYVGSHAGLRGKAVQFFDDYWLEYYRPLVLSSFLKMYSFRMHSTLQYIPVREGRFDLSPFKVRAIEVDQEIPEKKRGKKGVTIIDPHDENGIASLVSGSTGAAGIVSAVRSLHQSDKTSQIGIMKERFAFVEQPSDRKKLTPLDKTKAAQWTFTQVVHESLNPSVTREEEIDYARYISHPQSLPLVVSTQISTDMETEYVDYLNDPWHLTVSSLQSEDMEAYVDYLKVAKNPHALTVSEEDAQKKRYKAYGKWLLRGKSLFKQQPVH